MAAIREELVLADRFSSTFSQYLNMGRMASSTMQAAAASQNTFTEAAAQSNTALNEMTASSKRTADAVEAIRDAIEQVTSAGSGAAKQQKNVNDTFREGAKSADALTGKLKGLITTYLSFQGIKTALNWTNENLKLADVQRNAENQLKAVLANMGAQEISVPVTADLQVDASQTMSAFDAITAKASEIQGKGIYGDEAMIAGAAEFSTYFKDANAIMSMMDTLADYTMGMTGGGAVDKNAMVEYATGLGKIMSGSYDAMTKKGFAFSDAQKAIIEGTATEAQIVAELGAEYLDLSADMQAAAAINSVVAESWGGLYEAMSNTPEGKIIQLQNRFGDLREMLGNGIYPAVLQLVDVVNNNFPQIEQIMTGIAYACSLLIQALAWVADAAIRGYEIIVENSDMVMAVLLGIAAAASIAGASMTASAIQSAAAWTAANWPLVLIAGSVMLIIYMARQMGATWEEIAGTVGGCFGLMYAFAMNNFIVPAQNGFARFANFLGNLFNDPVAAVKILFLDMAETVLGYLSNVAHGIENLLNKIPGLSVNLTSGIDSVYNWVQNASQSVKDASGWKEYVKKWDFVDYAGAWETGSAKGRSIGSALDNFNISDFMSGMGGESFDYSALLAASGINDTLTDIGADTKAIRNSVALSEEDIKLLVDMATREYVNNINLTAQTPIINVTGQNTGDTEMDKRALADAIRDILIEESASHTDLAYT